MLVKSNRDAANCWKSLLEGQYAPDAWVFDKMEKKLTLERFQNEVKIQVVAIYIYKERKTLKNEQKVGMLLQKRTDIYKRSRDK